MESISSILDKMKLYLSSLKYPNIEIATEDDIVQIFGPQNRIKLLMWSLNQLSDAVAIPLEEDAQISYMSEIIYQWGFCKSNEKTDFVKCELEFRDQFVIFSRLFSILLVIKEPQATSKEVGLQDLKIKVDYSNNLSKKVRKSISYKAHEEQKTELLRKSHLLQREVDLFEKVEEFNVPDLKDLDIDGFEDDLVTFATNSSIIFSGTSIVTADDDKTLQLRDINSINEAASKLELAMKHVSNIKAVSNHKDLISSNTPLLNGDADKWFDKNFEKLEKMLQKCQPGIGFKNTKLSTSND